MQAGDTNETRESRGTGGAPGPERVDRPARDLALVSATALFLEMFLVRWAPSEAAVLGYYGNVILLGGFLGLGLGALLAGRAPSLWDATAPLLWGTVVGLPWLGRVKVAASGDNFDFALFSEGGAPPAAVVVPCFLLTALVFVPLGQRLGELFGMLPPLRAYAWDLGGSLLGTLAFGAFGATWFQPPAAAAVVGVGLWAVATRGPRRWVSGAFSASAAVMLLGEWEPHVQWSPYNQISVVDASDAPAAQPPADLLTMRDPPSYVVQVNNNFYMRAGTLAPFRYSNPDEPAILVQQYTLPHALQRGAQVLVLGSGAGADVEAALLMGAQHVVAVEIDPVITDVGRRFNASGVYLDPRVELHVQDARAFLSATPGGFDSVIVGFLDAQALLSAHGSVRMDAFVYTRQSMQAAARALRPGGLLSLSFFAARQEWLVARLVDLASNACRADPVVYGSKGGQVVVACRVGAQLDSPPGRYGVFDRVELPSVQVEPTTDDWPYLYLRERALPRDYAVTLALVLLLGTLLGAAAARRAGARGFDPFFFLMGAGFMLLETHAIAAASLLVGSTWGVTTAVVAGVLGYVLAANAVVLRGWRASPVVKAGLLVTVALGALVPLDAWVALPMALRVLATAVWMPLPVFLAGIVFSSVFRTATPAVALGSNLVGAVLGGVLEFATMVVGVQATQWLVLVIYAACVALYPREEASSRA